MVALPLQQMFALLYFIISILMIPLLSADTLFCDYFGNGDEWDVSGSLGMADFDFGVYCNTQRCTKVQGNTAISLTNSIDASCCDSLYITFYLDLWNSNDNANNYWDVMISINDGFNYSVIQTYPGSNDYEFETIVLPSYTKGASQLKLKFRATSDDNSKSGFIDDVCVYGTPFTYSPTTQQPTYHPTQMSTNLPTVNPTVIPTINPTAIPTVNPTFIPTNIPSDTPSTIPTTTQPTTTQPTRVPTTNVPTSSYPTNNPITTIPTTPYPTNRPSISTTTTTPTNIPTSRPAINNVTNTVSASVSMSPTNQAIVSTDTTEIKDTATNNTENGASIDYNTIILIMVLVLILMCCLLCLCCLKQLKKGKNTQKVAYGTKMIIELSKTNQQRAKTNDTVQKQHNNFIGEPEKYNMAKHDKQRRIASHSNTNGMSVLSTSMIDKVFYDGTLEQKEKSNDDVLIEDDEVINEESGKYDVMTPNYEQNKHRNKGKMIIDRVTNNNGVNIGNDEIIIDDSDSIEVVTGGNHQRKQYNNNNNKYVHESDSSDDLSDTLQNTKGETGW